MKIGGTLQQWMSLPGNGTNLYTTGYNGIYVREICIDTIANITTDHESIEKLKLSRNNAAWVTFLVSSTVHEMFMIICFKMVCSKVAGFS